MPELELIRLDADTVEHPEELAAALQRFRESDRAVLLGTQMVAKGHHFAGVALAAVVDADTGLGLPDFRAEERTFQLVTQLAGRSGRDAPGKVIVQSFQPDARPLELAARHDVPRFLADELARREELGYPPFRHIVRVVVSGPDEDGPRTLLEEVRPGLEGTGDLLGPAPLLRLRGRHRAQLVAKTDEPRRFAGRAAQLLAAAAPAMRKAKLTAVVDVDPQSPLRPKMHAVADETGEVRNTKLDPEAEARRQLALTQVRQYPDPVLRMQAREVESFDDDLASLVERMRHLLRDANGIGLAATQVGVLRRVFLFLPDPEQDAVALVNPRIVERSDERVSDDEGCLSLQGVVVPVERDERVTVEATDPEGNEVRFELEGLPARIAQHELDHLDGVLILDRTTPEGRREALAVLRPPPVLVR